jgi:hypothetical protein
MRAAGSSRLPGACAAAALLIALPMPAHAQAKRAELEGVWIVNGTTTENLKLTAEGAGACPVRPSALR